MRKFLIKRKIRFFFGALHLKDLVEVGVLDTNLAHYLSLLPSQRFRRYWPTGDASEMLIDSRKINEK